MATVSFDHFNFLIKISPDLLTQYAKHHGIEFKTKPQQTGEKMADEFMKAIEKEPENKQSKFY